MMNCQQIEEKLLEFSDDELGSSERLEVERHLGQCPACSRELSLLRSSWQALEAWRPVEPSPMLRARVWEELRREPAARSWFPGPEMVRRFFRSASLGAVSLACAAFCFSQLQLLPSGGGGQAPAQLAVAQPASEATPVVEMAAMEWRMGEVELFAEAHPEEGPGSQLGLGEMSQDLFDQTSVALQEVMEDS